jgi:hypothetical protein
MKKMAYMGVAKQKYGTSLKRRRPVFPSFFLFVAQKKYNQVMVGLG